MSKTSDSYSVENEEMDSGSQEEEEEEYSEEEQYAVKETTSENNHALNLKWCLGFNYELPDGCHNLTNDKRREIFYASGHTGVIYDYENRTQKLLQGHCNMITSCSFCPEKNIIITADKGPSALLVVWDAESGTPIKTIFDPHPNGVECLDVTEDGSLIVTLSREAGRDTGSTTSQTVSVWKWEQTESNCLWATGVLNSASSGGNSSGTTSGEINYQYCIRFNQTKTKEFVTTGKKTVRFWNTNDMGGNCTSYSPYGPAREASIVSKIF